MPPILTEDAYRAQEAMGRNSALRLARGRWRGFCEGLEESKQILLAQVLENQRKWMSALEEDTRMQTLGSFENKIFPLIGITLPNLIATELCSVQPMPSITSLVFYKDVRFGSNKGNIKAGQSAFTARQGWNNAGGTDYTSEKVKQEVIGAGNGSDLTPLSPGATLSYFPLRPNTITISYTASDATTKTLTDDGAGGILGASGELDVSGNTIDYNTGAILLTFASGKAPNAGNITITYYWNSEGSDKVPMLDLSISSVPITSEPRKVRARWAQEAAALFKQTFQQDADAELLMDMGSEIKIETDQEIITDLFNMASANHTSGLVVQETYSKTPDTGVSLYMHRQGFIYAVTNLSTKIYQANKKHTPNRFVMGTNMAAIVQALEGNVFQPSGQFSGSGVQYIGVLLGQYKCFMDPYMDPDTGFMAFKSEGSILESGFVWAPWIMFYATPVVTLDDFVSRRGLMSHYGKKPINSLYYGKIVLT